MKEKIRDNLKKGSGPKKAVFQTQKDLGGLDNISNKSYIASTKLVKNLSRSIRENRENTDTLKALIERQHQQGTTGHPVIRRITIDEISYSVCLFSDRILHNLANFCCTKIREYKSAFCNDFTFNLMKNPPCFALIGTYNNTSVESIRGGSCPAMLGPAIICHFKTERVVKWLFDSLVDECPGLEPYIQVLGADGEKALSNIGCKTFGNALLLLCRRHQEHNVQERLKSCPSETRKAIFMDIFGSSCKSGLVDSTTIDEFNQSIPLFYAKWKDLYGEEGEKFVAYFRQNKEEEFKHHVIKAVVLNAEPHDKGDFFYNNSSESVNSLIKYWQEFEQVDMARFAEKYEEMLESQEFDIIKEFLNLPSPYTVRPEFSHLKMDFADYSQLNQEEKSDLKKRILNPLVDETRYKEVMSFKPGLFSISRARENLQSRLRATGATASNVPHCRVNVCESREQVSDATHSSVSSQSDETDLAIPSVSDLTISPVSDLPSTDTLTFLLTESCPSASYEDIVGSLGKAKSLIENKDIRRGYTKGTFLVKSYSDSCRPHYVQMAQNFSIKCDDKCPRFQASGFCGQTLAVALINKCIQEYCRFLQRCSDASLTKLASKAVDKKKSGRKAPVRQKNLKKNNPIKISTQASFQQRQKQNYPHSAASEPLMNTQQLLSFPASVGSTNSQVTPLSAPSSSTANINVSYSYASHPSGIPHVQQNLQCPLPRPLQQFSSLATQPQQAPGNYNHHQIAPSTHGSHQHINQHGPPQRLYHPSPFRFRNQLSFWNVRAIHSAGSSFSSFQAVPPGEPLPDKPPIKESQHPYFLAKIKGNIKKCNGCDKQFSESAAEAFDLLFTIGRKESDVYLYIFLYIYS